jgi:hypothetical protein
LFIFNHRVTLSENTENHGVFGYPQLSQHHFPSLSASGDTTSLKRIQEISFLKKEVAACGIETANCI